MEPGQQFGKYEIRDRLAKGGMAEVYVAVLRGAAGFEKRVALKRILPGLDNIGEFKEMFAREARLVARLSHSNVVQVHDFDEVEGLGFYIAMELVEGCDLAALWRSVLEQGQLLPVSLSVRIVLEVAAALAHAHELVDGGGGRGLGLVHRDISPQNVLLSRDGAVKLTDFGIAKAFDAASAEGTRSGVLKGKFAYMSPEQARGEPLDGRSDLFSLGVVLWELLCGERLFREADDLATLQAVRRKTVPPPSSVNPEVSAALDAVVLRALERDIGARYQSAAELIEALEQLAGAHAGARGRAAIGRAVRGEPERQSPLDTSFSDEPVNAAPAGAETRLRASSGPAASTTKPNRAHGRGPLLWLLLAGLGVAVAFGVIELVTPEEPKLPAPQAAMMAAITEDLMAPRPQPPVLEPPPEPIARVKPAFTRAKPAAARPKRPTAAIGILSINVVPWGSVWVDGKELRDAPIQGLELTPGIHRVRAEHPRLGRREKEIRVRPGDNGTLIIRFDRH